MGWVLPVAEVKSPGSWLWRLFGPNGALIEHHQVAADTSSWEWQALLDLPEHVARQTDPADRLGSEARLVSQLGDWASSQLLSPVAARLAEEAPVEVDLVVPEGQ